MPRLTKDQKRISALEADNIALSEDNEDLMRVNANDTERIEFLENECNALFDENVSLEHDRDLARGYSQKNGEIADEALDQRDAAYARIAELEAKLNHALDAVANVLLAASN